MRTILDTFIPVENLDINIKYVYFIIGLNRPGDVYIKNATYVNVLTLHTLKDYTFISLIGEDMEVTNKLALDYGVQWGLKYSN